GRRGWSAGGGRPLPGGAGGVRRGAGRGRRPAGGARPRRARRNPGREARLPPATPARLRPWPARPGGWLHAVEQPVAVEIAHLDEICARDDATQLVADRLRVDRVREPGEPVVVVAQNDAPWSQQVRFPRDEAGQGALHGLAVDVAAPGGGEDGDVGAEVAQEAGPVSRCVLVEERAGGCLEVEDERAAVAASALVARAEVRLHVGVEHAEPLGERGEPRLLLLVGETEVADAHL